MHKNWNELIKPKKLDIDPETHSRYYGKFTCEPLEFPPLPHPPAGGAASGAACRVLWRRS